MISLTAFRQILRQKKLLRIAADDIKKQSTLNFELPHQLMPSASCY